MLQKLKDNYIGGSQKQQLIRPSSKSMTWTTCNCWRQRDVRARNIHWGKFSELFECRWRIVFSPNVPKTVVMCTAKAKQRRHSLLPVVGFCVLARICIETNQGSLPSLFLPHKTNGKIHRFGYPQGSSRFEQPSSRQKLHWGVCRNSSYS